MKNKIIYLLLATTLGSFADTVQNRLDAFREARKDKIETYVASINEKHLKALNDLISKTPLGKDADLIQTEIDKLSKIKEVTFSEDFKFPVDEFLEQKPFKKPNLSRDNSIREYLVGSIWHYYESAEFVGKPNKLKFLTDSQVKIGEEIFQWNLKGSVVWIGNSPEWKGTILEFVDKDAKSLKGGLSDNRGLGRTAIRVPE